MKYFLFLIIVCLSATSHAQTSHFGNRNPEAFRSAIKSELGINDQTADLLISIMNRSTSQMNEIVKDKTLNKEQKRARFTSIAAERDIKIAQVLRPGQVQVLRTYLTKQREQLKAKRSQKK